MGSWLGVMGSPDWGADPRFAAKPDRVANWDALYALMSAWSRQHDKQWIADAAQAAHVPSFPLREPAEQLASPQLAHRGFWRPIEIGGQTVKAPGPPFGLRIADGAARRDRGAGPMPLAGVRVLDFSWVIAGPTATRYLAAMGAEVIKIEAPGRGDPGRAGELHTVLGQAKRSIVLDLKKPEAIAVARQLAAKSDVLIENFATGVMDRLGLGAEALAALNPGLVYVSASGLGRTGPEAQAVAYGTLLQCYAGFAGLNRHPDIPPRVGFAWLDPMCGLMLAFVTAAALWHRRRAGGVARIDFSMIEAMLWTMAEPLLATQLDAPPQPQGNQSDRLHPARRLSLRRRRRLDQPRRHARRGMAPPLRPRPGAVSTGGASVSGALGTPRRDRLRARHLAAFPPRRGRRRGAAPCRHPVPRRLPPRSNSSAAITCGNAGFWDANGAGLLPGLPWRASFGRSFAPAPALGADTDAVLRDVLDLPRDEITALRQSGALG